MSNFEKGPPRFEILIHRSFFVYFFGEMEKNSFATNVCDEGLHLFTEDIADENCAD